MQFTSTQIQIKLKFCLHSFENVKSILFIPNHHHFEHEIGQNLSSISHFKKNQQKAVVEIWPVFGSHCGC
jgi:hypothetical protein